MSLNSKGREFEGGNVVAALPKVHGERAVDAVEVPAAVAIQVGFHRRDFIVVVEPDLKKYSIPTVIIP